MSDETDLVLVPRSAVEWLQRYFPTLIGKAGLKIIELPQKVQDDLDFGPEPNEEQGY